MLFVLQKRKGYIGTFHILRAKTNTLDSARPVTTDRVERGVTKRVPECDQSVSYLYTVFSILLV